MLVPLLLLQGLSYPSLFWHFNNITNPGPGLTLSSDTNNAPTITAAGTMLMDTTIPFGQVDSSIVVGGDSTFVLRFNPSATSPSWSRLIDFGNGPESDNIIIAFADGNITAMIFQGNVSTTLVCEGWNSSTWNILIFTVGEGMAAQYINGAQCQSTSFSIPNVTRKYQYIGKSNSGDPSWIGELDFVWYLPRVVGSSEAVLLKLDAEMMGNAWTFQSPAALDYRVSLIGSPSLAGGTLNLHDNSAEGALINPSLYSISGPTSFAARARADSYPTWAPIIQFSNVFTNDAVTVSIVNNDSAASWAVWEGTSDVRSMQCPLFWQIGEWVDIVVTVEGTTGAVYHNGLQQCTSSVMIEPAPVTREWQYIGKSRVPSDGGWNGSIEYVMHWNRSLLAIEAAYISDARVTLSPWLVTHFSWSTWEYPFSGNAPISNGKVSFAGGRVDQDVQVDSSVQLSTPFTVSMYVLMRSWQADCRLMDFANGPSTDNVAIAMDGVTPNLLFVLGGTVVIQCNDFWTLGNWTLVTLTHDGSTASFYRDGVLVCSQSSNLVPAKSRLMQFIGKSTNASNNWFDGSIDYFMVFQEALSTTQVAALPNAWDRYSTTCAAVPTDSRVDGGTCVNFGRQGTTCDLECNAPYVAFNPAQGVCLTQIGAEQAAWNGQSLNCVSQCSTISSPENGFHACLGPYGSSYENASCLFNCSMGFTLTGSSITTCSANGTWTPSAPTCVAVDCPSIDLQRGNATCDGLFGPSKYTATCNFTCASGFQLTGANSSVCQLNGTWSAVASCIQSSSPTLPPVASTSPTIIPTAAPTIIPTAAPTRSPTASPIMSSSPTTLHTTSTSPTKPSPASGSPTPTSSPTGSPSIIAAAGAMKQPGLSAGGIGGIVVSVLILVLCASIYLLRRRLKFDKIRVPKIKGEFRDLPKDPREVALEGTIKLCERLLKAPKVTAQQKLFLQSVIAGAKEDKHTLTQVGIHSGIELTNFMANETQEGLKIFNIEDFEHAAFLSQGEGGAADLYKDKCTGREIVIKVPHHAHDLEAEAKVWRSLGLHPNVARMIGIAHLNNKPRGIVMEYYAGGSLDSQAQEFSANELHRMAIGLARGLQYLHGNKVIHRDLAARNILVARDRRVVITDFGLSRKLDDNNTYQMATDTKLPWRTLAPELIAIEDGRRVFTEKTDIWALGVTLWELATKRNAYADAIEKDPFKVAKQKIGNGDVTLDLIPIVMNHQNLAAALVGCFNRDPSLRPTAEQLRWLLKDENSAETSERENYVAAVQGAEYI